MKYSILKLYLKTIKNKSLIAGFAVLALVATLLGQKVLAADPRFNFESLDLKTLNVANVTQNSGWQDYSVSANSNDQVAFQVYYRNGIADSIAHNTRIRLTFPTIYQNSITVNVALSADNAPTVYDSVTINSNPAQRLTFNTNNIRWYPDRTTTPTYISATNSGQGFIEVNLGDIGPCWEHQGYVNFYAGLSPETTPSSNPNLTIQKTVSNQNTNPNYFVKEINAANNDRIKFQIQIQNTGNTTLNNVFVYDNLPANLTYVAGSTRQDESYINDIITSGGINLGSLYAGASRRLTFEAIVNTSASYSQTLTNYAYVRADGVSERNDTARIYISGQPQSTGVLNIVKTARNISNSQSSYSTSIGANPGDRIGFMIQLSSYNNYAQINNVRVWDILPSGLSYITGSAKIDGSYISDTLVTGGINIGTLFGTQTRNITFEATVNSNVSNQILTNYAYVSGDNVSQQSANCQINVGTPTIVTTGFRKTVANLSWPNGTDTENQTRVGDILQYSLTYTNNTGGPLYNLQIMDTLPSYTSFVSSTQNGLYDKNINQIVWNLGTLNNGSSVSVSYQAKVENGSYNFVIVNSALLRANNLSPLTSNETKTTIITPQVKGAYIQAVTGSDSLAGKTAAAVLVACWIMFFAYLFIEYLPDFKTLKLNFIAWRIRQRNKS